jgi:uncharacterized membrane protein YhaH (DUF805 family)
MDLMLQPLRRYADFAGRSRRKEFWSYVLLWWIAYLVLMYLDTALGLGGSATGYADGGSVGFNMTGGILSILFAVGTLVPNIAVSVRRLHDSGKSGWMFLLVLIPLFGWLYLLFLYVQPGLAGPNAYGPDPKGGQAGVFA